MQPPNHVRAREERKESASQKAPGSILAFSPCLNGTPCGSSPSTPLPKNMPMSVSEGRACPVMDCWPVPSPLLTR